MLKSQNSTGPAGGATNIRCQVSAAEIDNIAEGIEKSGGMIAKALASKHLTELLLSEMDRLLRLDRGQVGKVAGMRSYQISDAALATLTWLIAEAWENSRDLSEMVDRLQEDMVPLANAAYDARKAARAVA